MQLKDLHQTAKEATEHLFSIGQRRDVGAFEILDHRLSYQCALEQWRNRRDVVKIFCKTSRVGSIKTAEVAIRNQAMVLAVERGGTGIIDHRRNISAHSIRVLQSDAAFPLMKLETMLVCIPFDVNVKVIQQKPGASGDAVGVPGALMESGDKVNVETIPASPWPGDCANLS